MSYTYNPLLVGKLDRVGAGASRLSELDDVNTAGTVNGKVLTFQSGTWLPAAVAGGGDMLISQYVTGAGTVYNASRLAGDVKGTVQAHAVEAGKITTGTFGLARIPSIDDARIPDLDTLSYSGAFAEGQIPSLPTTRITTGTFGLARIPSIDNAHLTGGITSDKIPALSGTAIAYPLNVDTVGTTAIKASGVGNDELAASGLDISKFTVGTAGLARIPTMDDAHVPDLETLSYGAAFATAQIPNLPTTKITSGSFNANRIPILPTDRYGSAVLLTGAQSIGGTKTFSDIPILPASNPTADNEAARKAYVDSAAAGDIDGGLYSDTYINTADINGGTF